MAHGGNKLEHCSERRGPLKNRSCTDWPCLVIFVTCTAAWIAVGSYGILHGNVQRLLAPEDSYGRKCGMDEPVIDEPYLVFFDLRQCLNTEGKCKTPQVCRNECPSSNWLDSFMDSTSLNYTRSRMICESGINAWNKSIDELRRLIEENKCAKWYLNSSSVIGRCFPAPIPLEQLDQLAEYMSVSKNELKQIERVVGALAYGEKIIDTVLTTRVTVLALVAGGAVVSILNIFVLRWLALPCVFISIIVLCSSSSYLAYYFYESYHAQRTSLSLILTVVFAVVAGFVVLLVACLFERIRLACRLIEESSKAVSSILSSLVFPILPWLLHLAAIVYTIVAGLYLYTLVKIHEPWQINTMLTFHLIVFIWIYCFVTAFGEMTLSSTFATWYWTFRKIDVPFFALSTGVWQTVRYHLGTVAFGSFLITICRLTRYVLEATRHFAKNKEGSCLNACTRYCLSCAGILVMFLEKFFKFMNRNAYIVCAVYGKGLCESASEALNLVLRNAVGALVLDNIVSWMLFLGKAAIAVAMGSTGWWYFSRETNAIELRWVPVVLIVVGTYLVANLFFGVYEVAVDTIFLCFLEDCERHDGSVSKPYYATRQLRKLMHKDA